MTPETQILEAFATSEINCVALVDDAFDPPTLGNETMGALLELIEKTEAGALAEDIVLTEELRNAAIEQLLASEYDGEEVIAIVALLFRAFVRTGNSAFDPNGRFATLKSSNLAYVIPLVALLRKCDPTLRIVVCGSTPSELDEAARAAQLIFMDFFLRAGLSPDGEPNLDQEEGARRASLERLKGLISGPNGGDATPAIILMSSHDIASRVDRFREDLAAEQGNVFTSRFDFINKKHVTRATTGRINIAEGTFEALLAITQTYSFGHNMHRALLEWRTGATAGVQDVWKDITSLTLKDFAYLTRFRLAQEGMTLSEYLDWLFGESLIDAVGRRVDWGNAAFSTVDRRDGPVNRVRGAFDGPTDAIAAIFDRVRVEKPKTRTRRNFRMGDIYTVAKEKNLIRCIVTPDCDLILRSNGKRKAQRLLTISGQLSELSAANGSVADFIMLKGKAYNISWNVKDIQTFEFAKWPAPGKSSRTYRFVGSLRPLYAEEVRGRVIDDLSRLGMNVAPAMGITASVKVIIDGKTSDISVPLIKGGKAACSIIFSRGNSDMAKIIFFESALNRFLAEISNLSEDSLEADQWKLLVDMRDKLTSQRVLYQKLCSEGVALDDRARVKGIGITTKIQGRGAKDRPWCQFVVETSEFS